jgi:hypothetical protein
MNRLIAFCGLDCSGCDAYLATQAQDVAAQARVLEHWRIEYGNPGMTLADVTCDGCTSADGRHGGYCGACPVRACGEARGVVNCAHCDEYETCPTLNNFIANIPPARANLEQIRLLLA